MRSPRLLALGSLNVDVQLRADRWPEPDETLVGRDFLMIGGGKAANVAWLARHLGVEAELMAHVGTDPNQKTALHFLREKGVDLSGVRAVEQHYTGISLIIVHKNARKGILLAPNANDAWSTEDTRSIQEALESAPAGSILVTNLEIPAECVKFAIRCAKARNLPVVLDPSPADRLDRELLESGCYLTPNQSEAQRLTHITIESAGQAIEAGRRLLSRGNPGVCVKLGNGGCAVVSADQQEMVSAPPVQPVDTTGAGDAFAGALGIALLEQQSLVSAARFAVAAAAHAVTGYGSHPSYPSRSQIENLLRQMNGNGKISS